MNSAILHNLIWAGPTVAAFLLGAPLIARIADRWLRLAWPLPAWVSLLGLPMFACGVAIAMWCVWLFATFGAGTPNPLVPPERLVIRGPYRISRNPMMLGAWLAGLGLAALLRSPSLLVIYLLTICAGVLYVRCFEEPELTRRFGETYRAYARSVPRWLCSLLLVMCWMPLRAESAVPEPAPSVVVLIKCKAGMSRQWKEAFEKQIAPAIRDARDNGDEITGFQFLENIVAGQPHDFVLIIHAKSFAFFDRPRSYPHYQALYLRLGQEQASRLLAQMESWEAAVTVTLMRAYGASK